MDSSVGKKISGLMNGEVLDMGSTRTIGFRAPSDIVEILEELKDAGWGYSDGVIFLLRHAIKSIGEGKTK